MGSVKVLQLVKITPRRSQSPAIHTGTSLLPPDRIEVLSFYQGVLECLFD